MKQLTRQIALLERVDRLIRLKATGRPKKLAERLEVSEATVFRMIDTMKELNAPVYYDLANQSYAYSKPTSFRCGFFMEDLDKNAQRNLTGGFGFKNIGRLLKF